MKVSDVHERVVELLNENHISKYRLALNMGMTPGSFYNMFRRKTMPSIDTIEKICNALDITICDFFVFASDPKNSSYIAEDEAVLLEMYRPLSSTSKDRVRAYVEGMYDTEKGKKE